MYINPVIKLCNSYSMITIRNAFAVLTFSIYCLLKNFLNFRSLKSSNANLSLRL